jgi:Domain of unknown function (DUF4347)/Domain of unknown function (DUF4082)
MFWADNSANSPSLELSSISSPTQSPDLFGKSSAFARTIAFVDSHVADYTTVMANITSDVTVLLDPTKDGIDQITEVLSHYQNLTGIEIVSHGNAGEVQLGKNSLNADSLTQYTDELQQWNKSLALGADILLYGCYVAADQSGQNFIRDLSNLTGADVAASSNLTGSAAQGGDWNLEYTTGQIETKTPFNNFLINSYQGTLQSIFTTQTPDNPNQSDGVGAAGDYELGLEFTSAKSGQIDAVRYYKAPSETGTHVGSIWSITGTLLGSVTFANETASGWQQQAFTTPVNIAANTTYVVSVNANSFFAVSGNAITTVTNGDLSAVADGSNGVYNSTPGAFPTGSNNSNYFRDIVFTPTTVTPPTNQLGSITTTGTATQNQILTANVTDADGLTGVTINYQWQQSVDGTTWTSIGGATSKTLTLAQAQVNQRVRANATYTDALGSSENILSLATTVVVNVNDLGSIAVSGTATQNQVLIANLTDADGLTGSTVTYKWQQSADGVTWNDITGATSNTLTLGQAQVNQRVRANAIYTDALGGSENVLSVASNPVSGSTGSGILESIFTTQTPDNPNQSDGAGAAGDYELGLEFTSAKAGQIKAVRYYKAPSETGTHVGSIWSITGTLLGSVTFANETASGWQQQAFTTPVNIAANTTYVVSVNANSFFAVSGNSITTITNGDLSAVADGSNGVYNSTPGAFPTGSNNSNYFRDIVFTPNTVTPPTNQLGIITASGTTTQNQILTANVTDADGLTGVTINYQWQQSADGTTWTNISGATSKTLTLGQAQVNQRVRANAIYTDVLGSSENILSAATAVITAVTNTNRSGTITVSGTTTQNRILTATVADADGLTGASINYRWQQSIDGITWNNIAGATSNTITLTQDQVSQRVRATATYTDTLGTSENPFSLATAAVINVNDNGKVILKGSATVGRTLTETVLDADGLSGVKINYNWQQSTNGTNWSNITGATAKSLTLTNGLLGKQVRVRTTYTDVLGAKENIVSAGALITAQNAIVLENQKVGTSDWQIGATQANNNEIAGYGDATSINKGQALNLKISLAQAGQYGIDVYRLGYYGGAGGRLISSVTGLNGVTQAAPTIDPTTRLVECKWNTSYTIQTGANWTSGLYLAKLTDSATGKQSYVEFIVRDDNRPAEIGFQDASNTAAAYNNYGGYSSYAFNSINNQAAYKVSFDRPLSPTTNGILAWEYQTASWAEAQGYDISYYSNSDVQTNPFQLYSQNAFLSVGHDEYWSMDMRNNVEKARDNGTNLAFFSANSAYWRVRFESSTTGQSNRVLAIYKDNWNLDPVAQLDNSQATTRFRSTQVNRPENALLGVMYTGQTSNTTGGFDFVVSNAADPYYAGTGLQNGDKIPGLVGYEWDGVVNNGLTPAGLVVLSQSPAVPDAGTAPGLPAGTNAGVSNAVRYTATSGAKVFSTGSIQWVWGLNSSLAPNPRQSPLAQKIATNVFADLGAQARTPTVL